MEESVSNALIGKNKNIVNKFYQNFTRLRRESPDVIGAKLGREYSRKLTEYFTLLYERDLALHKPRRGTQLVSAQSRLSQLRKFIRLTVGSDATAADRAFLAELRLLPTEQKALMKERSDRWTVLSEVPRPEVDADRMVEECRSLLENKDPALCLAAIACLTGRRMAEILCTVTFQPPKNAHTTSDIFWSFVYGRKCRRGKEEEEEREEREDTQEMEDTEEMEAFGRDIPLLGARAQLMAAIDRVRKEMPCEGAEEVNAKYSKRVQRVMKKHFPGIGNVHNFRNFYILVCFHYFNEHGDSFPSLAAEYLGCTKITTSCRQIKFKLQRFGRLQFEK